MRRRRRAREGQEKRKSENRPPILKKLCAALLRSFRGQHSEKIKGSARGVWDPRKGQQPFRSNPNGRGPHHHVEVTVDWCRKYFSRGVKRKHKSLSITEKVELFSLPVFH